MDRRCISMAEQLVLLNLDYKVLDSNPDSGRTQLKTVQPFIP